MLIVAYKINDLIVGNYNNNETPLNAALIVIATVLLSGISFTWIAYQYVWFKGCT